MRDYLAVLRDRSNPEDKSSELMHYGVKGQKWGVTKPEVTEADKAQALNNFLASKKRPPAVHDIMSTTTPDGKFKHVFKVTGFNEKEGNNTEVKMQFLRTSNSGITSNIRVVSNVARIGALSYALANYAIQHDDLGDQEIPDELKHYGIKGQKWGVRRSDAELSGAAKTSEKTPTVEVRQVVGAASGESSSDRYTRLLGEAKNNGASSLSDQDLKFINARKQAVDQVAKMTQENPNWLKETGEKVLKNTAQTQLQNLSDSLAKKYIGDRLADKLKGPEPSIQDVIKSTAQSKARQRLIDRGVKDILDLSSQSPAPGP